MTFIPKFTIASNLVNLLSEIAICRERILRLRILPKREVGLMRSARLRMIHSSTAIEGNPLALKEVEAVLLGKIVTGASEKDRLEITNYGKVLRYIDKVSKKKINNWEKAILQIHHLTTQDILPKEKCGAYRKEPVFVIQRPGNKIVYRAPAALRVPKLTVEFCRWLSSKKTGELSPVIIAAISHHQLVTIHPFSDGNGRTARALATLVLYFNGYDIRKIFALEDYYNLDRSAYYRAIRKVREEKDLSSWLEYFAQGFLFELRHILQKAEHFSLEAKTSKPIYLSQRQRDILDFIVINGKIYRSDVVDIATVSAKTAYRELEFLREQGLIIRKGKGPSSHYILIKG